VNPQLSNDVVTFALRPLDVDVTLLYGYVFPHYRGGPMKYTASVGLATVLANIRESAQEYPLFWQPSPLIVECGADFASLDHSA
jgi:3-hydroxyacyl-CoA dehydrogenase